MLHEDGRYPRDAYAFLQQGLEHTTRALHGSKRSGRAHHVTGQQLCEGLRDLAIQRWGLLARDVLASWGIHSTRDFGEMVFLLVRNELLGKQDSDRLEDFDDVFDFDEAFGTYGIRLDEQN
ncbi:MAG: hypothetical protein H3C42_07475 [Phycisphaerae bacterium]|nr:hypothetical protein [Phycisphaerae bacterium]NUQ50734.1 hypothetical protein [Phycisphaerae bacterium]